MICMEYKYYPAYQPNGQEPGAWDRGTWDFKVTTSYRGRARVYTMRAGGMFSEAVADAIALARVKARPFADPNGRVDVTVKLLT